MGRVAFMKLKKPFRTGFYLGIVTALAVSLGLTILIIKLMTV